MKWFEKKVRNEVKKGNLRLTVDDEDLGIACGGTRDVQEMNVVLSKRHNRLVR